MTPERRREIKKKYRESHREELRIKGREYARKRRAEDPDASNRRIAEWRARNPEKVEAIWRARDPEKSRAACRKWAASHREHEVERRKRYLAEHPEQNRAKARRRRAAARLVGGSHTEKEIGDIMIAQGSKCADCRRKFTSAVKPTLDHVLPITKGGSECADNLRWVCGPCNSKKYNKDPKEWAETTGRLFI